MPILCVCFTAYSQGGTYLPVLCALCVGWRAAARAADLLALSRIRCSDEAHTCDDELRTTFFLSELHLASGQPIAIHDRLRITPYSILVLAVYVKLFYVLPVYVSCGSCCPRNREALPTVSMKFPRYYAANCRCS
jgi:hypothetical protein